MPTLSATQIQTLRLIASNECMSAWVEPDGKIATCFVIIRSYVMHARSVRRQTTLALLRAGMIASRAEDSLDEQKRRSPELSSYCVHYELTDAGKSELDKEL